MYNYTFATVLVLNYSIFTFLKLQRALIAIRISVLQYASHVLEAKKSVLERIEYLIYQYDIRYTTGTPGLFEQRPGTLRRSFVCMVFL